MPVRRGDEPQLHRAHLLGFESTLGHRGGHRDVRMLIEWALRQLEPVGARKPPALETSEA